MAEARAVYLAGCGLPQRWSGRRRFVVAELGFGTGLNLIALLDVWRRTQPQGGHLHFFSIEAHPMAAAEAARALSAWPEIAPLAALLTARWPGVAHGFHRLDFPQLAATVDIGIMEAGEALEAWTGYADAWFLDGFSPARNPAMWRPELLQAVARRSAPGARAATYTAAGTVRRDLAAAGFIVERRQGFGGKRHRLEARLVEEPVAEKDWPRVAVIGTGIAGASLVRAFAAAGVTARVFSSPGPKASDGPAALVAPRLDAGLEAPAALFAQAFARAIQLYGDIPGCVIARGARQLAASQKDEGRFRKIAASDLFEPGSVRLVTEEPGAAAVLVLDRALVVDPAAVLDAWLRSVERATVARLEHHADDWRLLDEGGEELGQIDIVCLAAGHASSDLWPLPLSPVRGQASVAREVDWPVATLFAGGYALPTRSGVIFGATHDRGDDDPAPRENDHRRNLTLAGALPDLAGRLAGHPLGAHAGVRATTADYLPLAGAPPDGPNGLMVLTGLGSRGFTLAPLLAEHVAAVALGLPSPLPVDLARLVDPGRFARRAARRRGESRPAEP